MFYPLFTFIDFFQIFSCNIFFIDQSFLSLMFAFYHCLFAFVQSRAFIHNYFMIHTFSVVIQQPLFNVQPSWIFNKLKVQGGLDNVAGKSGADELNS